jgi:hypothetical protein
MKPSPRKTVEKIVEPALQSNEMLPFCQQDFLMFVIPALAGIWGISAGPGEAFAA